MTLFFQEYGSGPPLFILHGLLGSLDNWHTLSNSFGETHRILAVDQRNHGRSPHAEIMTYDAMADDLLELFTQLGISSASVLGHSMGGKTAMQFALRHPDRVERLIAVDIAPRSYPALHEEILDALLNIDLHTMTARQQVDEALARQIPDPAIRQFLMKNLARNDSGSFRWKANIRVLQKNIGELARELVSQSPFEKPTLFLQGDRSHYLQESDLPGIRLLFPRAEIISIEAGHWVHADAPDRFRDVVLRFLSS